MTLKKVITMKGTVVEPLPNAMFRVQVTPEHEVLANISERMHRHFLRILPGDCVVVELSPDDLNRGYITSRC